MWIHIHIEAIPEIDTIDEIPEALAETLRVVLKKYRKHVAVEICGVEEEYAEMLALGIDATKEQ